MFNYHSLLCGAMGHSTWCPACRTCGWTVTIPNRSKLETPHQVVYDFNDTGGINHWDCFTIPLWTDNYNTGCAKLGSRPNDWGLALLVVIVTSATDNISTTDTNHHSHVDCSSCTTGNTVIPWCDTTATVNTAVILILWHTSSACQLIILIVGSRYSRWLILLHSIILLLHW